MTRAVLWLAFLAVGLVAACYVGLYLAALVLSPLTVTP